MGTELERERQALTKADRDLHEGAMRLRRQEELMRGLPSDSPSAAEGERLTQLLRDVLQEWRQHRSLIVARIAVLEARGEQ